MGDFDTRLMSRRLLLRSMAALAGTAALPLSTTRPARAAGPALPANCGSGRSVAIIGAGMAGLTAGWKLARAGFKVTIYEGDSRYGGRSLTVRPDGADGRRGAYRAWWFRTYNPKGLFPAMYVSRYKEDKAAPGRTPNGAQICEFLDDRWDPNGDKPPVDLFLNAGPGRIPSDHVELLRLCGEIGVPLEPYIFQSNYNLLRSARFTPPGGRQGDPIAYNQVNYSLRGRLAERMAELEGFPNCGGGDIPASAMARMLKEFGDLNDRCKFPPHNNGPADSPRLGFSKLPGGWNTPPLTKEIVPLQDVLDSGFVGGGNPELVPGSFLFNADNILWQNSLLQPIGGMDRIWQRLLVQTIPPGAVERQGENDPRWPELARKRGRYVGDLVLLNHPVTSIVSGPDGVRFMARGQPRSADFCISTMAPKLLLNALPANPGDRPLTNLRNALEAADPMVPAIKVGWQAKTRFWEQQNHIYGGISWIDEDIGQIWYPSEDFNASTGVLTGAYNRGPVAASFGDLTQAARLEAALSGGEKLHPRNPDGGFPGYRESVYRGVTIAWQYMPFQQGGWAPVIATRQPEVYRTMVTPLRRLYVAGDTYSYLPGWLEGAVTSADKAVEAIGKAAAGCS